MLDIWLKIARKGSGIASVTYAEALDEAPCFGWIDGQKQRLDEAAFLKKFTRRGKRSVWSQINMRPIRILFVCSLNQWRSPTAEYLYRRDSRFQVRSAGVRVGAKRRVSGKDLTWADQVFVMDREQKQWITSSFRDLDLPPITVLDIPDEYEYMDPRLQAARGQALDPEFEARFRDREEVDCGLAWRASSPRRSVSREVGGAVDASRPGINRARTIRAPGKVGPNPAHEDPSDGRGFR